MTRPALKTKALRFHLSQKEPFMEVSIPARFSTPHVTQIPRSGSRDCACRYKCNSSSSRKFNNWYGGHFESACFALQQDHLYQIENKYVVYIMHPNVHIPFNCIVAVLLNDFIRSTRSIFIRPAYPHSHCFLPHGAACRHISK